MKKSGAGCEKPIRWGRKNTCHDGRDLRFDSLCLLNRVMREMTRGSSPVLFRNMDYDATDIAVTYDCGRDHGPEFLNLWMNVLSSHVRNRRIKTILDLGCGTGRFTEALAVRFDADVIGIDPSKKMLAQARSKPSCRRVRYQPGRGESIPLPDNSVDLIFMSMIFHHFDNPALAARECRRVLSDDGDGATNFLRAGTPERSSSYPYVRFF